MDSDVLDVYYESAHSQEECGKYLFSSMKANYLNINFASALKNIDNSMFIFIGENCLDKEKLVESYLMCNPAIEIVTVHHAKNYVQLEQPNRCLNQIAIYMDWEHGMFHVKHSTVKGRWIYPPLLFILVKEQQENTYITFDNDDDTWLADIEMEYKAF